MGIFKSVVLGIQVSLNLRSYIIFVSYSLPSVISVIVSSFVSCFFPHSETSLNGYPLESVLCPSYYILHSAFNLVFKEFSLLSKLCLITSASPSTFILSEVIKLPFPLIDSPSSSFFTVYFSLWKSTSFLVFLCVLKREERDRDMSSTYHFIAETHLKSI